MPLDTLAEAQEIAAEHIRYCRSFMGLHETRKALGCHQATSWSDLEWMVALMWTELGAIPMRQAA